jgi:3-dehydroquinate dehydratase-2
MKIMVINGPNLNMLGRREPEIYGNLSLAKINELISNEFGKSPIEIEFFQSNEEGVLVTKIQVCQKDCDAIVINPAAYSHYSIAILDAIKAISIPTVEVHLSNICSREEYRRKSITGEGCIGVISGFGYYGYIMAINSLINILVNSSVLQK